MEKENSKYDLIIYGASGLTGKYVVREALKFLNKPSSPLKSTALAGRNRSKLTEALKWASQPDPPPEIPILTADSSDPASLRRLASQAKLIVNCVGPFRLYGEPVVSACVDCGCDYLDVCGEPEFMEKMEMELEYHEKAAQKGILVVSACGFISLAAEMGTIFNSRQWVPPMVPIRIDAYLSVESDKTAVGRFATYESAVLGMSNVDKLKELRQSRPRRARPVIPGRPPSKESVIEHQKKVGLWAVKLPSADSSVVRRTQSFQAENPGGLPGINENMEQIKKIETFWSSVKPAHFGVKLGSKSLLGALQGILVGIFIMILGKFSIGGWLLLNYPSVFSLGRFRKEGPTEEEIQSATFKMWFVGHGFSDRRSLSN